MDKLTSYVIDWSDLARWAGEQPREKGYNYYDCGACAMAQYLRTRGLKFEPASINWCARDQQTNLSYQIRYFDGEYQDESRQIQDDSRHDRYEAALQSRTFGRLRDALLALLGEEPHRLDCDCLDCHLRRRQS